MFREQLEAEWLEWKERRGRGRRADQSRNREGGRLRGALEAQRQTLPFTIVGLSKGTWSDISTGPLWLLGREQTAARQEWRQGAR